EAVDARLRGEDHVARLAEEADDLVLRLHLALDDEDHALAGLTESVVQVLDDLLLVRERLRRVQVRERDRGRVADALVVIGERRAESRAVRAAARRRARLREAPLDGLRGLARGERRRGLAVLRPHERDELAHAPGL